MRPRETRSGAGEAVTGRAAETVGAKAAASVRVGRVASEPDGGAEEEESTEASGDAFALPSAGTASAGIELGVDETSSAITIEDMSLWSLSLL